MSDATLMQIIFGFAGIGLGVTLIALGFVVFALFSENK